ncbi:VOC family protein [Spirosoma validum]|uniref:VOC family protein n=1 Tax=Spirosoma validum TaxID=2771355 RepID=A0A927B584_9BACT|nr:VOC family protein [Spirosoma validum]MBD2755427.1 VOC family protein [Spirosoma validum]
MTQINAYLTFDGNCREAMTFYQECLDSELYLQTVGESPVAAQMTAEWQQKILHASLTKGNLVLMGSDMNRTSLIKGNSITLSINCSSEEELTTFFTRLSAGGKIIDPIADMFWGAKFGAFTDKFGINWIVNYDKNQTL